MMRIVSRDYRTRKVEPGRRNRSARRKASSLLVEPLEDRTLLSGPNYAAAGSGLANVFNQLQQAVNEHLLAPSLVGYALPLVGRQRHGCFQPNRP
jgi:hypothetical protein